MHSASRSFALVATKQPAASEGINVFIDGDAMPKTVITWLEKLEAETHALEVYKAVGASVDAEQAKSKLLQTGIPACRIHVKQAQTGSGNAADAILTVLYGRHAGRWNLILSADKKWFSELQYLDRGSPWNTRWLAFDKLTQPELCKIFEGYKANAPGAKQTNTACIKTCIETQEKSLEEKLKQTFLIFCQKQLSVHQSWGNLSEDALAKAVKSVSTGQRFRKYWQRNGGGKPIAAQDVDVLVKIASEEIQQKKKGEGTAHKLVAGTFLDYCHLKLKQVNWKCRTEGVAKQFKQIFQSKRFRRFMKERCQIDSDNVDVQQVLSLVQAGVA